MFLAFFRSVGLPELLVILVIVLLLFGRRVPEIAKALGKGVREFKKGISGLEDEIEKAAEEPTKEEKIEKAETETEKKQSINENQKNQKKENE